MSFTTKHFSSGKSQLHFNAIFNLLNEVYIGFPATFWVPRKPPKAGVKNHPYKTYEPPHLALFEMKELQAPQLSVEGCPHRSDAGSDFQKLEVMSCEITACSVKWVHSCVYMLRLRKLCHFILFGCYSQLVTVNEVQLYSDATPIPLKNCCHYSVFRGRWRERDLFFFCGCSSVVLLQMWCDRLAEHVGHLIIINHMFEL